MKRSKEIVATHEVGHALTVLRSPIRNHVVETCLHQEDGEWRGHTRIEGDRVDVDPNGVYEFAKSLAGPVTELHFYPSSVSDDLDKLLKETGGVVNAMRHLLESDLMVDANWWPDLEAWRVYCLRCLQQKRPIDGTNYLNIEEELQRDVRNAAVKATIEELSAPLTRHDCLDRDGLLAITIDGLPELRLPESLPQLA
jgi:hypothetical protein